jgi:hypothetical protein
VDDHQHTVLTDEQDIDPWHSGNLLDIFETLAGFDLDHCHQVAVRLRFVLALADSEDEVRPNHPYAPDALRRVFRSTDDPPGDVLGSASDSAAAQNRLTAL